MSLVNQMLKDLETRRAPEMGGEAVLRNLSTSRPHTAGTRSRLPVLIVIGATVTLAIAAVAYWYTQRVAAPIEVVQNSPLQPVVPAVAAAKEREVAPVVMGVTERDPAAEAPARIEEGSPTGPVNLQREQPPAVAPLQSLAPTTPMASTAPAPEKMPLAPTPPASVVKAVDKKRPPRASQPAPVMERVTRPRSPRENAQSAYLKGADLVRNSRLGEAESALRSALDLDPNLIEARELLAAVLIRSQRGNDAEQVLRAGLERNKAAYSLARIYARMLTERNEIEAAIQILEESLPAPALDPEFYGLLAALYQRVVEHAKAAEAYRRVLAITPERGVWWTGLGISLERLSRTTEAYQAYRRARGSSAMTPQLLSFVDGRLEALGAKQ